MKNTSKVPLLIDDKTWYSLSIFYARQNWVKLLLKIERFFIERKNYSYTVFCSEGRGEHIEVFYSNVQGNLQNKIIRYFQSFLQKNPSTQITVFPYGKALWCNYPNNTVFWKYCNNIAFSEESVIFNYRSVQAILYLIENDTSHDAFFSAALFLITKSLTCIEPTSRATVVSTALSLVSNNFKIFTHVDFIKKLINEKIDSMEISRLINFYLNEKENPPIISEWLNCVISLIDHSDFIYVVYGICKILGLSGLYQIMLLELINQYFNPISHNE